MNLHQTHCQSLGRIGANLLWLLGVEALLRLLLWYVKLLLRCLLCRCMWLTMPTTAQLVKMAVTLTVDDYNDDGAS